MQIVNKLFCSGAGLEWNYNECGHGLEVSLDNQNFEKIFQFRYSSIFLSHNIYIQILTRIIICSFFLPFAIPSKKLIKK